MKQDIIESNKLIAEFMGYRSFTSNQQNDYFEINNLPFKASELQFHTSWDWLHQAIDKIETLGYVVAVERYITHITKHESLDLDNFINCMATKESDTRMQIAYDAVIQFIKWYNTQTH